MPKSASLSLHKNSIERRRKREMSDSLVTHVRKMVRECDVRAYAVVGIGADGKARAVWDSGGVMPLWAFGETMGAVLREDVLNHVEDDDWRPPLHRQRSEDVGYCRSQAKQSA